MKRNFIALSLLLTVTALLTYSGMAMGRPDLIVSSTRQGHVMVRTPLESQGRAFLGMKSSQGFVGTWVFSISTADYPSSRVITQTLTLRENGTALLKMEKKSRVASSAETHEYETDTKTRHGTWSIRGGEAWIDLEELV